jgi:SNF2 family DNA or RNA helicase
MFYSEAKNTLVVNSKYPEAIVTSIPDAMMSQQYQGIVYVPMNLDTCTRLADMGITPVMTPIEREYDWAGRMVPYEHQKRTAGFCVSYKRGFVLNGMGTGKTLSFLWAADYLMLKAKVNRALIVSPLSTLETVWAQELFINFPNRSAVVLHGTKARRNKLLEQEHDFYIINYDGLPSVIDELKRRKDIDLLIVDECASYRSPKTNRWKLMRNYINTKNHTYIWFGTGTPTPNAPTDAWGQARLLELHRDLTFTKFRDMTMKKITQFVWQPKYGSQKIAAALLTPSIRYALEDCIDLPPTIYTTRQAQLSKEQKSIYRRFLRHLHHEFETSELTAVNAADRQNKLIQIACGFAYARNDSNQIISNRLDVGSRVSVLKEVIEEVDNGKIIVFVPYKELVSILDEELRNLYTLAIVDGSVSKNARDEIFRAFQHDEEPKILVAHPKTMAHGLTLTSATTIIWYAPYASNEIYTQANARIVRPSQTQHTRIVHISATVEEDAIYARLKNKQALQGLLLDIAKKQGIGD